VSEPVELVADGDPCPIHGLESRVYQGPCGPFNQCQGCRDDFLDWYGAQRYVVVEPIVLERKKKGHRSAAVRRETAGQPEPLPTAPPEPEQIGLAL
jgi:hypothetical protein